MMKPYSGKKTAWASSDKFVARAAGSARQGSGGFVLVAVLIVIMLASMVAISLMFRLRAEETASAAGSGSEQAWAAAMSGLYEAMRVAGGSVPGSLEWQDDPATFRDRLVCDDGTERWYYTVYAPSQAEGPALRFGVTDEAGKLNLNSATEAMLLKLPQMTAYLAQGLLDFLDPDNTPHPEGAEQEYYDTLPHPYAVRNGPLVSLEELLLVRGFTPGLLYGEDANLNFTLDPNEDDGDGQFPLDNKDGKLDRGLRQYLTVYAYDLNEDSEGLPRIELNNAKDAVPEKDFPPALAQYIEALRRNKVELSDPAELLEAKAKLKDEQGKEVELSSGVGKTELPLVLEYFTTTLEYRLRGRVNVNTASAAVLQTLPEVDQGLADAIVSARGGLRAEQRRTPAWLYQEDLLDAAKFKKLSPLITARARQFHVQVVGYGLPSGRFRVLEGVIDLGGYRPAIVYLREITRLGLPFKIDAGFLEEEFAAGGRSKSHPVRATARLWKEAPHG